MLCEGDGAGPRVLGLLEWQRLRGLLGIAVSSGGVIWQAGFACNCVVFDAAYIIYKYGATLTPWNRRVCLFVAARVGGASSSDMRHSGSRISPLV